jgi:hypothetical protein
MYHVELAYRVRQEQYADLRREADRERLAKAASPQQQRPWRAHWVGRSLLALVFALLGQRA